MSEYDVVVIGGGVAGRTAGTFTARAGLETAVFDDGNSILQRNAHLENFPGFPEGVNPRLLLDLIREQAYRAGCEWVDATVEDMDGHPEGGFVWRTRTDDTWAHRADRVVVATAGDRAYLSELPVETDEVDGKEFLDTDGVGRTSIDGLYAAGRIAGKPLQAVVAAGHGAEVASALLEDADIPYAFDWSVPEGYFTERGKTIPPGVEEISEEERLERERRSLSTMRDHFEKAHPEEPTPHPELVDKE